MSRPLRLEFSGALYHITSRGNRRETIYEKDEDREDFLALLGEVCEGYHWLCHAYCLMSNHYHLLVETPEGILSKGMRQLNGVYSQRFNRRHDRVGHVFQGRYKAIFVEKESYLLELARYIVLNPFRARMVRLPEEWPWSSYRATAGVSFPVKGLHADWLLSAFGATRRKAVAEYKKFVAQAKGQPSPWEGLRNQVYLGSESFVGGIQRRIDAPESLVEVPQRQRRPIAKALKDYAACAADRNEAIIKAYGSGGYSMKEIRDYFGLHYSRVSKILSKARGKT